MMRRAIYSLAILGLGALCRADDPPHPPFYKNIGSFHRTVTTKSADAQRYFDQGLTFLYSFHYREAMRNFQEAARLDPGCSMAYWGVAMANGPHINDPSVSPENAKAATAALGKAEANAARASIVEKTLIQAASSRFENPHSDDRKGLDFAYALNMRQVWKQFPNDADVGALTAEAIMDLRPWDLWTSDGKPQPGTEEITSILARVLEIAPNHPLGLHLTIHAWEASPHPEKADAASNRLRNLLPGIAHMVHMPSHIDVLRGRWKEAVVANEKAIAADRKFMKNRPVKGLYGAYMAHNYDMLAFAAMMRGQKGKALGAIDEMFQRLPDEWLKEYAGFLDPGAMMARPLEVRMRFGMWDEVLAQPEPGAEFPVSRAMRHFARGVALAAKKDFPQARAEEALFVQSVKAVPTDGPYAVGPQGAILKVAELALAGEILFQEGKRGEGLAKLRSAAEAEDQVPYMEPPYWLQPVRHALGAALLTDGKLDEAEKVYRQDLKRHPENGWSLLGLATSLERQNRFADAKPVRKRLAAAWKDTDTPLTSSCLCLPGK